MKDILHLIEHLHEIDQKFFRNSYSSNLRAERATFMQLVLNGRLYIEWNKGGLEKMTALRQELLLTGLEVKEILETEHSIVLQANLPKSPSRELLFGKA